MKLLTVFQIADILREPPHRCEYVIRKYRLKPRRRVGLTRLFDEAQVEAIEQGLYGIQVKGGATMTVYMPDGRPAPVLLTESEAIQFLRLDTMTARKPR